MSLNIRLVRTSMVAACVVTFSISTGAQETLRVKDGEVSVICPLTVGGSFEAKTEAVEGEIAVASEGTQAVKGELSVDLEKLETGIGLRDRHMKEKYLEVDRGENFEEARLRDIRVERLEGKTTFHGLLSLHGHEKPVNGTAEIKPNGSGYRVDATFPLRMSDFQIPNATYLGVGVKDEVQVRVSLATARATTVASR